MSSTNVSQVRLLNGVGIACSGFLTGYISLFSVVDRHVLLATPTTDTAKIWQSLYNIGKNSAPYMAIVSSGIFGYLAYQAPTKDLAQLYKATALLLPMIAPFTVFAMTTTNDALHEAADKGVTDVARIRELLDTWWKLNAFRALIPATATALAIWASLQPTVALAPFRR